MSYKSLLFCPDEKSARLVTQVLSELDFTVEIAAETFATAKKLTDEHFDALVVDCQNEQDASVLFKAARNSSLNHSSLSVAVVEGQTGVAKAFRIGANLVLTKPINVEQSKGTLRVARGLLKKSQAKPAPSSGTITTAPAVLTSAADSLIPSSQSSAVPAAPAFSAAASVMSMGGQSQSAPSFSVLEVEKETTPATEASDAAVLDSLPQLPTTKVTETSTPAASMASPFATSVGSGAAAAPALDKPAEVHTGAGPLVTNEPIVKAADAPQAFEAPAATPTFASLGSPGAREGRGGKGFLKVALILLVLTIGGYFAWPKLQSRMQKSSTPQAENMQTFARQPAQAPVAQAPTPIQAVAPVTTTAAAPTTNDASDSKDTPEEITATPPVKNQHVTTPENIEIQEMPFSRDAKVTVTPKPAPLVVKSDNSKPASRTIVAPVVAPSLDVAANNSSSTIANLITTEAEIPKPAPGTIRISQGVSQGLLMKKVSPTYPAMALQLRKEAVVELLAKVSKEGRITNVKVVSGDPLFVKSAADAVKQWQYRPYLLNGQPLEVETQISVSFKLPK